MTASSITSEFVDRVLENLLGHYRGEYKPFYTAETIALVLTRVRAELVELRKFKDAFTPKEVTTARVAIDDEPTVDLPVIKDSSPRR